MSGKAAFWLSLRFFSSSDRCVDFETKLTFIFKRIRRHEEESAILRAYIAEWVKFFVQTEYLPKPFSYILEQNMALNCAGRNRAVKSATALVSAVCFIFLRQFTFSKLFGLDLIAFNV